MEGGGLELADAVEDMPVLAVQGLDFSILQLFHYLYEAAVEVHQQFLYVLQPEVVQAVQFRTLAWFLLVLLVPSIDYANKFFELFHVCFVFYLVDDVVYRHPEAIRTLVTVLIALRELPYF